MSTDTRTPHPIADIICAWANGFRVEFRYRHRDPNGWSEKLYMPDPEWHLCGKQYSAFSGVNEHRIHADDLAAWESFKRKPAENAASDERARILTFIREQARSIPVHRSAYLALSDKISRAEDIF